ncbi:hypothetical protein DXX93_05115 [Thalassotalea euphylliae]|uniref:Uncharacterized protein n=1 Tax=Thalassotalea euphylliae TaxID=1655234 RepID=A0A3E0TND5_9GAMM|nr:hypothetical protein [Thalassotalea euphylliae]REL26008.1 hypothetical protein DXX93_05115 [Thalassotalea euphylliae]
MKVTALIFTGLGWALSSMSYSSYAQATAEDYGFAIKCYTQLSGGSPYLYRLWLDDRTVTPEQIKEQIIGEPIDFVVEREDGRLEVSKRTVLRSIECRYDDETFVNVNAIRLDEASDK